MCTNDILDGFNHLLQSSCVRMRMNNVRFSVRTLPAPSMNKLTCLFLFNVDSQEPKIVHLILRCIDLDRGISYLYAELVCS